MFGCALVVALLNVYIPFYYLLMNCNVCASLQIMEGVVVESKHCHAFIKFLSFSP